MSVKTFALSVISIDKPSASTTCDSNVNTATAFPLFSACVQLVKSIELAGNSVAIEAVAGGYSSEFLAENVLVIVVPFKLELSVTFFLNLPSLTSVQPVGVVIFNPNSSRFFMWTFTTLCDCAVPDSTPVGIPIPCTWNSDVSRFSSVSESPLKWLKYLFSLPINSFILPDCRSVVKESKYQPFWYCVDDSVSISASDGSSSINLASDNLSFTP